MLESLRSSVRHSRFVLMVFELGGLLLLGRGLASAQLAPTSEPGPYIYQAALMPNGLTSVVGDTALVAADGVVYVFARDPQSDEWSEATQLVPTSNGENFGRALAFDGTTAIVGADGAAYVYHRGPGAADPWEQTARLVPDDGDGAFGAPVAVDRDTAMVGPYIFRRDLTGGEAWTQVVKLVSPDGRAGFAQVIAVSNDIAIVEQVLTIETGTAYVFDRNLGGPDHWGVVKRLAVFQRPASVAIKGDTAIVGGGELNYYATIFNRNLGGLNAWGRQASYGPSPMLCCGGTFRIGIGDDRVILFKTGVGGTEVHVLARNQGGPDAWGRISRFLPEPAGPGAQFSLGPGVAIDADTALIGYSNQATGANAVLVFTSDLDGDGLRDGHDPCPRDPLNDVEGACNRAGWSDPVLDSLITQTGLTSFTVFPDRLVITSAYTNTSNVPVKNPFFEVTEINAGSVLLNGDATPAGVGSTLSPDVGDGVLSPGETVRVEFSIRRRPREAPLQFSVTFKGEPQ